MWGEAKALEQDDVRQLSSQSRQRSCGLVQAAHPQAAPVPGHGQPQAVRPKPAPVQRPEINPSIC